MDTNDTCTPQCSAVLLVFHREGNQSQHFQLCTEDSCDTLSGTAKNNIYDSCCSVELSALWHGKDEFAKEEGESAKEEVRGR